MLMKISKKKIEMYYETLRGAIQFLIIMSSFRYSSLQKYSIHKLNKIDNKFEL